MGTDDLFHKRKARKATELARHKARRKPYAKVLIVCEGEKTEPLYFEGLQDHYGLNSANVEICGENGTDPLSIFEHAKHRYGKERNAGDSFDRVYCVFDKDTHSNYIAVVDSIKSATPKGVYFAIPSIPCFEYWFLLHFNYTTKPYNPLPHNSVCDQVIADLRNYMPEYAKGACNSFQILIEQLDFAKQNAARALSEAEAIHTDNPSTHVHELVEFLQSIKKK